MLFRFSVNTRCRSSVWAIWVSDFFVVALFYFEKFAVSSFRCEHNFICNNENKFVREEFKLIVLCIGKFRNCFVYIHVEYCNVICRSRRLARIFEKKERMKEGSWLAVAFIEVPNFSLLIKMISLSSSISLSLSLLVYERNRPVIHLFIPLYLSLTV